MKIAYITTDEILGPQNTGGIQCSNRNLLLLKQAFGEDNIYLCVITKNKEHLLSEEDENIATFFTNRSSGLYILRNILSTRLMFNEKVEKAVLEHLESLNCEIAFFDRSNMGFMQKKLPKKTKQVLFMQGIEKDYFRSQIRKEPLRALLYHAVKQNEKLAVKNADLVITLNQRDAGKLKEYYNRIPDLILPITADDSFVQSGGTARERTGSILKLLFVGSLFPPNEHGIKWLINNVMPHVDAELTVVGRGFEKLSGKLNRNNVNIIGTVDNLPEYYHSADAIVSPILFGAGMKVKTAEALMYGKPMFATDEALEGYEPENLKNIYRCNTAQEFISAINTYSESETYITHDEDIRALFLEKYHTPKYVSAIKELLMK